MARKNQKNKTNKISKEEKKRLINALIETIIETIVFSLILYIIVGPFNRVCTMVLDLIYEGKMELDFCLWFFPIVFVLIGAVKLIKIVSKENK